MAGSGYGDCNELGDSRLMYSASGEWRPITDVGEASMASGTLMDRTLGFCRQRGICIGNEAEPNICPQCGQGAYVGGGICHNPRQGCAARYAGLLTDSE